MTDYTKLVAAVRDTDFGDIGVACWEQFLKHRAKMEAQE